MEVQHNIPNKNIRALQGFVNREADLQMALDYLEPSSRTWLVEVFGMGGIGKTTFALKTALSCAERGFFDFIIWTSAKTTRFDPNKKKNVISMIRSSPFGKPLGSLDQLLNEVFKVFNYSYQSNMSVEDKVEAAYNLLRRRRALIIVDDFEFLDEEAGQTVSNFIGRTLPDPTKAIITTRRSLQIVGSAEIHLWGLGLEECKELVLLRANKWRISAALHLNEKDFQLLHKYTFGNPLALELSVARLRYNSIEVVMNALSTFNEDIRNVDDIGTSYFSDLTDFLFEAAYQESDDLSQKIWLALAKIKHPVSEDELSRITDTPKYVLRNSIDWLNFNSLLSRSEYPIELHPLAQSFARSKLQINN